MARCGPDARRAQLRRCWKRKSAGHFLFGSVGGGVWKTENAGRTWFPISDEGIPIGSIGAIAVAPSNPEVLYVGTGESDIRSQNSYGIGMYKSNDSGKTWKHIGLEDTRQIARVVVDPANPNRVYVAALGHVYDANPDRGIYRSIDGGAAWKKILFNAAKAERCRCGGHRRRSKESACALRLTVGDAAAAVVGLCAGELAGRRSL